MFKKILIANRGDVALRIVRACKEMGIKSVAIHSTADADSMHVRLADESVCVGPASSKDSYLNMQSIISAAVVTHADAIHPGIGFLSENAKFADMVVEHGFEFIGPSAQHMRMMGDKAVAKQTVAELGVPVVPGSKGLVENIEEARVVSEEMGYPVLVKASMGGGGKGMKVAMTAEELDEAWNFARAEAKAAFGDDSVYIEKFLKQPKHIEIQLFGDKHGNGIHLGERDCSVQRRNQKLVEESPSPVITEELRNEIGEISANMVRKLGYVGAGTIEYLYEDGRFYFMEMNTRLQVEHPVTEMVTGIDLVKEQIRVANGEPLSYKQEDIKMKGHAIEARVNAEDPETFMPSPGKIKGYHTPGGLGIRVDSALYGGYIVPSHYDSLIAKVIVHGDTREEAIARLHRALDEFVIDGVKTSNPLVRKVLDEEEFREGGYDNKWLERYLDL
ncbi:MAG: acetyl-CoA carboxylase biotin carboxylase subunit [Alphaproteobacteria bacterium]|jgi:acetyl-CoA carboxylase biotin carboxylase subunit|nr:acetyl-CoA carboxylase biotin carboxylase subunit [Alphaproteobacteria bacterium]MCV6599792.1 acetyl-CoA carboxylase biotin carboxylase subunit [Alphaproteobacteria bacterium]